MKGERGFRESEYESTQLTTSESPRGRPKFGLAHGMQHLSLRIVTNISNALWALELRLAKPSRTVLYKLPPSSSLIAPLRPPVGDWTIHCHVIRYKTPCEWYRISTGQPNGHFRRHSCTRSQSVYAHAR